MTRIIFQGVKVLEVITIHLKRPMVDPKTKYGNAVAVATDNVSKMEAEPIA